MTSESMPEEWTAPEWYEDYGDARIELEKLRSLAIAIRNAFPDVRINLEQPEPGLMELILALPNQETVEVHTVARPRGVEGQRFAIFISPGMADEVEYYSDSVADIVTCIGKRLTNNS